MNSIIWKIQRYPINYERAMIIMQDLVTQIAQGYHQELIWILEHNDVYTKGSSSKDEHIIDYKNNIPIISSNRGGQITYHGKGQKIIYPILDISCKKDIRSYIDNLQQWVITMLNSINIEAFTNDHVGVWVLDQGKEKKIASIGVGVRKWITYHGIAINVNPDLNKFKSIIPCGITQYQITSLKELGINLDITKTPELLKQSFYKIFTRYYPKD